jgi:dipeptidyl aminopeptidase/acylaminoacyl peptidase
MQAVFAEISAMIKVSSVRKPMLVMQGANDPRVPQSKSEQVVAKLRENGVQTRYVLFADEGHGFQKKTQQRFVP